jgi:hypothetical protein
MTSGCMTPSSMAGCGYREYLRSYQQNRDREKDLLHGRFPYK